MVRSTSLTVLSLFLSTASSAILERPQRGNLSLPSNVTAVTSNPPFRWNIPGPNDITCDGTLYGNDLDLRGCREAYSRMPRDDTEHSYGQPSWGQFDYGIPIRYLGKHFFLGEKRKDAY